MENIFAKRRARLLAMKAMRENYVPGEKLVTCPHCGGESQRRDVAAALSVCPLCGYHFPMGAYYRLSSVLDPGSFRELFEKLPGQPHIVALQSACGFVKYKKASAAGCCNRQKQPLLLAAGERGWVPVLKSVQPHFL